MFDTIFQTPALIARDKSGPYAEERVRFLNSLRQTGYNPHTIYCISHELLRIAHAFGRSSQGLRMTSAQVERLLRAIRPQGNQSLPASSLRQRSQLARRWLRYLGLLQHPSVPFTEEIEAYCRWARDERGLGEGTIHGMRAYIRTFLVWYARFGRTISRVQPCDIDHYLSAGPRHRQWTRQSVSNVAKVLRGFFRFASNCGWVPKSLAVTIHGPRLYTHEQLPCGPTWTEVRQMSETFDADTPAGIRDRAIFMLLAVYGLRSIEVCRLQLQDIDWERDLLQIRRGKGGRIATYPLCSRSAKRSSSTSKSSSEFVSTGGISHADLPSSTHEPGRCYHIAHIRLRASKANLPHRGAHALRHACATHLLASGFSMKEIGDQLGHRRALTTRIYAKVDMTGLRRVAAFDIGALS